MNEEIKEFESKFVQDIKEFVDKNKSKDFFFDERFLLFMALMCIRTYNVLNPIKDKLEYVRNFDNIKRYSEEERFEIIKRFCAKSNMFTEEELDNYYKNGTISFLKHIDYGDDPEMCGGSKYNIETKEATVEIINTGMLSDAVIGVHELSHFKDHLNEPFLTINKLLTESTAITYEMLLDEELINEIPFGSKQRVLWYIEDAETLKNYIDLILMYLKYGDINEEVSKNSIGVDSYHNIILYFMEDRKKKPNKKITFFPKVGYVLSSGLSTYLFLQIKKDPSFIERLNRLHSVKDNSFFEFLNLPQNYNSLLELASSSLSEYTEYILSFESERKL